MAAKRYSTADQAKRIQDRLANFRAKGVDAREIHSLHPGGVDEALKLMESEIGFTRDQAQAQIEENRNRAFGKRDQG